MELNLGFFNPLLAATTGRWQRKPMFWVDAQMRSYGRHLRRSRSPFSLRRMALSSVSRQDCRSVLTWHFVCIEELRKAASFRKKGNKTAARQHLQMARDARVRSIGWRKT